MRDHFRQEKPKSGHIFSHFNSLLSLILRRGRNEQAAVPSVPNTKLQLVKINLCRECFLRIHPRSPPSLLILSPLLSKTNAQNSTGAVIIFCPQQPRMNRQHALNGESLAGQFSSTPGEPRKCGLARNAAILCDTISYMGDNNFVPSVIPSHFADDLPSRFLTSTFTISHSYSHAAE